MALLSAASGVIQTFTPGSLQGDVMVAFQELAASSSRAFCRSFCLQVMAAARAQLSLPPHLTFTSRVPDSVLPLQCRTWPRQGHSRHHHLHLSVPDSVLPLRCRSWPRQGHTCRHHLHLSVPDSVLPLRCRSWPRQGCSRLHCNRGPLASPPALEWLPSAPHPPGEAHWVCWAVLWTITTAALVVPSSPENQNAEHHPLRSYCSLPC